METQIIQVQKQFQERIIAGDYVIEEYSGSYVIIMIDGKYNFNIWHGKEYRFVSIWTATGNFMRLPEFTEEAQKTIYAEITKRASENAQAIKEKKINDLKVELANLQAL